MTADLATLQAEYRRLDTQWRNGQPWLKARARDAYNTWFRESCRQGDPPDNLETYDRNELRRFLSRTIHGTDGHAYYGPKSSFTLNTGKTRNPRLYWYEKINGPLTERGSLKPICGEPTCIVPEHQKFVPWSELKQMYRDSDCVGALQVAAQRLGCTPSLNAYDKLGLKPSSSMIQGRFSGWNNALKAAGLPPVAPAQMPKKWSAEDCVAALRDVHGRHGFVPSRSWWERSGMKPSFRTVSRRFDGWEKALEAAGLR